MCNMCCLCATLELCTGGLRTLVDVRLNRVEQGYKRVEHYRVGTRTCACAMRVCTPWNAWNGALFRK